MLRLNLGRSIDLVQPKGTVTALYIKESAMTKRVSQKAILSQKLQQLQRQRAIVLKSRNMQATRLQAIVAGTLGYSSGMKEKDREEKFREASAVIKRIADGEEDDHPLADVVKITLIGIDAFNTAKDGLEKQMIACAKQLPVAKWVEQKDQRGFGLLFLAIVIGETGDLCNYANPAKVWRRLGCAPWTFNGQTLMGATWRGQGKSLGKLPKDEWSRFGYSPRRRSIAYLIGEGMVKQNGEGPYRTRYDEMKAKCQQEHPDYPKMRCHRHGMLLATKLLLKNLWIEWNDHPTRPGM